MTDLDRRLFLRYAGLAAAPLIAPRLLADTEPTVGKRIVLSKQPLNLEMPIGSLREFLTPTDLFFIRSHFPLPSLDLKTYRLVVTGAVKRELKLTLDDLQKLRSVTRAVTLECGGNGRSLLKPTVKGVPWGLGGVSTAEWTGVPLAAILDLAGVQPGAVEVILDGADRGDPKKDIQPPENISFSRSLPLVKAQSPETMLAWGMNGKDLRREHGAPLRAIVAGWYGVASVKWLSRIIVTKKPFAGFNQTIEYTIWTKGDDGLTRLTPITTMEVKATIASPAQGDVVSLNREVRIHGAAWAGESDVARVDVSTDGGKTWSAAKLLDKPVAFSWRRWEHPWMPSAAGAAVLMARATDKSGRVQPMKYDPSRRGYMISFVSPIAVTVKA